jgi:hypothetical protein
MMTRKEEIIFIVLGFLGIIGGIMFLLFHLN